LQRHRPGHPTTATTRGESRRCPSVASPASGQSARLAEQARHFRSPRTPLSSPLSRSCRRLASGVGLGAKGADATRRA
jgi:hypothetical protein